MTVLLLAALTLVPQASRDVRHDTSPPLRSIRLPQAIRGEREMPRPSALPGRSPARDGEPGLPASPPARAPFDDLVGPLVAFEGTGNLNGRVPPDTAGDVGPHHVVEWVNLSFAVYDRAGTPLYGPVPGSTLWAGFGGRCEASDGGDPIVLYDALADRWLVSQLAFAWPQDFHQCIAVSATADPTGPWHRYDFPFSPTILNDYPKFGVWPDAYYLAVNQIEEPGDLWRGQGVLAYERAKLLQGLPAQVVSFDLYAVNPKFGGALPSDLDGPLEPPAGAPNVFVEVDDDAWGWPSDRLTLWNFHVDWANPSASTFGLAGQPNAVLDLTAAGFGFDADLCGYSSACIPQPGGSKVDALSDRLMWRLAYRNFGTHEALVVNHTVDVDGTDRAGVRWYEIRNPANAPTLHQAGTWSPDPTHRWMAGAAMDGAGGVALAYSAADPATFPSIRYAGRVATDPPGAMAQGEGTLVAGTGAQTGARRWGDYASLTVDPTDDCTFWVLHQYVATTGSLPWQTRVGAFRLPDCGQCPLVGIPSLAATKESGGTRLTWTATPRAATYDVIEGRLSTLRATTGDFVQAVTACPAIDLAATTFLATGPDPAVGDAAFWLVRATRNGCRGTLGETSGATARDEAGCP